jgi:hypothetical protein
VVGVLDDARRGRVGYDGPQDDGLEPGDATLASAFVARWCVGAKVETAGGMFRVREDELEPGFGVGLHRTREVERMWPCRA